MRYIDSESGQSCGRTYYYRLSLLQLPFFFPVSLIPPYTNDEENNFRRFVLLQEVMYQSFLIATGEGLIFMGGVILLVRASRRGGGELSTNWLTQISMRLH